MSTTGLALTKVRIEPLAFGKVCDGYWSYFDVSDGRQSQVGPHYLTKGEGLADLERYARAGGWIVDHAKREWTATLGRSAED